MRISRYERKRRRGAAAVEMAAVLIPLFMFLFGVFEFGRLLMDWNILNNAVREGCRYAVVNNTASSISTDVTTAVTSRMSGRNTTAFTSFSVSVSGTSSGVSTSVNNLAPGDMITVTVSGQYKFLNVIPFIHMPTLTINSSVSMLCEGGT